MYACQQLVVLDISSCHTYVPELPLVMSLVRLENLEVLVLQNTKPVNVYSNRIINYITAHNYTPKIRSLIGLFVESGLSDIPTLKYMTDPKSETRDILVRNLDSGTWSSVRHKSKEWYEAHGTEYFYPESTIKFMDVIKDFKGGAM